MAVVGYLGVGAAPLGPRAYAPLRRWQVHDLRQARLDSGLRDAARHLRHRGEVDLAAGEVEVADDSGVLLYIHPVLGQFATTDGWRRPVPRLRAQPLANAGILAREDE